jgi:superfamily II DNA helicase RecQ
MKQAGFRRYGVPTGVESTSKERSWNSSITGARKKIDTVVATSAFGPGIDRGDSGCYS